MTFGNRVGSCTLCGCERRLTFHHLIPRKLHRRPRFRQGFTRDQLADGIDVCSLCHRAIHRFYDEMTLGTEFASLTALKADPKIARHIVWARKQRQRPG